METNTTPIKYERSCHGILNKRFKFPTGFAKQGRPREHDMQAQLRWLRGVEKIEMKQRIGDVVNRNAPIHVQLQQSVVQGFAHPLLPKVKFDEKAVTEALIAQGHQVDAKDLNGDTPLMWAVKHGRFDVMQVLLAAGADPNEPDCFGDAPLKLLVCCGNDGVCNDIVKLLIEYRARVDAQGSLGQTALMWAARSDLPSMVKALVESEADVNMQDSLGMIALMHHIIETGSNTEILHLLLDAGTLPGIRDTGGRTAIMYALNNEDKKLLEVLFSHGADPNDRALGGVTPLMCCAGNNKVDHMQVLIAHRASIDCRDEDGWGPLMWSTTEGSTTAAKLLLKAGASPNERDASGMCVLMHCAVAGKSDFVKTLLDQGATIGESEQEHWKETLKIALMDELDPVKSLLMIDSFSPIIAYMHGQYDGHQGVLADDRMKIEKGFGDRIRSLSSQLKKMMTPGVNCSKEELTEAQNMYAEMWEELFMLGKRMERDFLWKSG